jgi:hypothetical protein
MISKMKEGETQPPVAYEARSKKSTAVGIDVKVRPEEPYGEWFKCTGKTALR